MPAVPVLAIPCLAVGLVAGSALAAGPAAPAGDEWPYAVARGDTLVAIAETYLTPGTGWRALQKRNAITDPRVIRPGSTVRIPLAWLRSEATVAEVVYARGDVRLHGDAGTEPLRSGMTVRAGAVLSTGEQSSLALRLADGTRLMLAPGTRARIEELLSYGKSGIYRAAIGLEQGSIESQVTPSKSGVAPYRIRTPVAVLGVRGTDFRAHAADSRAGVEVLTGQVAAAAGAEVAVDAGFGTVARAQGVAPPVPLLPAPALAGVPASPEDQPLPAAWPAVPGAVGYRLQVYAADGSLQQDLRTTAAAVPAGTRVPPGAWRLRVRAVDPAGIEGRDADTAFARTAALPVPPPAPTTPPPPRMQLPLQGQSLRGPAAVLSWFAVEPGRRYRVQVAADAAFTQLQVDASDDTAPAFALVQRELPLPPGRWYWRVAALGDDGRPGPFGPVRSFTLEAAR